MKPLAILLIACSLAGCRNHEIKPPAPKPDGGKGENTNSSQLAEGALYNGVELPAMWPLRRNYATDIRKGVVPEGMWSQPELIGAMVGRQLFVDDFLIQSSTLDRVFHYPEVNTIPVLTPDRSWETSVSGKSKFAAPFSDGVWYDEVDRKFKMWYMGAEDVTCYAESTDGITWTKPELDVYPGTNVVRKGTVRDSSSLWLDKSGKGERYRMFEVSGGAGKWCYKYLTSADGIHWRDQQANSQSVADRSTVFYSPFRDVWVWSMRHNVRVNKSDPYTVRARDYMEHKNPTAGNKAAVAHLDHFWFGPWQNEKPWSGSSANDGAPGIYNHDAIPYESVMLGFFSVWQGPENDVCNQLGIVKRNQIMVGYSRDGGYSYTRKDMNPFIALDEDKSSFRSGNIQSAIGSPIIVGNKLYFYFSGRRMENGVEITSTGLATLRRDGFASMSGSGSLTTRKLLMEGSTLWVNARVGGSLKVELLDANQNPIENFTITVSAQDNYAIKVFSGLEGVVKDRAVSIRFTAADCDLYSFWCGDAEGHSRGYTAGGGPGLHNSGIDK